MTLPSSGSITSTQIVRELGLPSPSTITIPADVRVLCDKPSGSIVWPTDFYGKVGITLNGYAGSSGSTVTIPSDSLVGDVAVLYDMPLSSSATQPTLVLPSGWTSIIGVTGGNENSLAVRSLVSYRILTSGQPGSVVTGMNGTERNRKIMIVLRPSRLVTSVTPAGWSSSVGGGDLSAIAVPSSSGTPNMVVIGFAAAQSTVLNLSFSPDATNINAISATRAGYKHYTGTDTPVNHTIDVGDFGDTNGLAAGYINFNVS